MQTLFVITIFSILATYIWRCFGVAIGERINPDGEIFEWIACVAYAMLAGLMARVVLLPVGLLDETSLFTRLASMVVGFSLFFYYRRNFIPGTLGAVITFSVLVALGF